METQNKELKNLTPEMVEELRTLGVTFDIHLNCPVWWYFQGKYTLKVADIIDTTYKGELLVNGIPIILPAPSLQEVFEKLPRELNHPDTQYWLELSQSRINKDRWCICYKGYDNSYFYSFNSILAAYELLKWVATNHPETIKGGSDEK